MSTVKKMRLIEGKKPEPNSDSPDARKNGWDNLPYPVIHAIAKLGLHHYQIRCTQLGSSMNSSRLN